MRVLITGGAGFIGSHLCDVMQNNGFEVTVLDNLSTGSRHNLAHLKKRVNLIYGDIRDKTIVEKLTKKTDLVLHMAAALGVSNILENPIESISTNFFGSEVVLNSAVKFDKRVVIASTSEIYGKNSKFMLNENDDRILGAPQILRWTYSEAKALEEAVAFQLFLTENLRVSTIRFFNTVGPRQTGKYGMVLPRFIEAAMSNKELEIYGNGTQKRVFCHVLDAVSAVHIISVSDNTVGEVFNVGGNDEISISELANIIIKYTNSKSKIVFKDYADIYNSEFEDIERRVPDLSKIKSFVNWQPKFGLNKIIEDSVNSYIKEI